ncbi:MAG: hypothetical protein ABI432_07910 [Flavobacteriales bacterium]
MTTFTGKLITPPKLGGPYIYEVTHTGGVVRVGTTPRIPDDYDTFILDYVETEDSLFAKGGTDQWDLTILYKNAKPRAIDVEIQVNGKGEHHDRPTVQDGKM